jgi:5'/3'-nucleotidase SurE
MAGALTGVRSIALSYGIVTHPSPPSYLPPAHALSARIISSLINNWDEDADLYSVNVPLVDGLLSEPGLDVYWTSLWRNRYGKLFKDANKTSRKDEEATKNSDVPTGATLERVDQKEGTLHFKWAPDLRSIIRPAEDTVSPGSDAWALLRDAVSVTPLKAAFAEASHDAFNKTDLAERKWKL